MTEDRARAVALAYLTEHGIEHDECVASRFLTADRFNRLYGFEKYQEDFWVVEFKKKLEPGVAFESPSTVAVMVFVLSEITCDINAF